MEFHRRNSCGRRPGFRRRPRKPSTAKPGWRSISTLYLTAIFISAVGVVSLGLEKNIRLFRRSFHRFRRLTWVAIHPRLTSGIACASSKSRMR